MCPHACSRTDAGRLLKRKRVSRVCACKANSQERAPAACIPRRTHAPSLRFPPPFRATLTLALAVGCVGYKAEASAKLLHILIHLTPAEFHLLSQLCLGGAAGCGGCNHKGKDHCAISNTTFLKPTIIQQPHRNLTKCISKLLHRIQWWFLMGKPIKHFIWEVTKWHPLIVTPINSWRSSCVFPPVIQNG